MPRLVCGHLVADIDAIIFDKDGTLADSRPFLQRLAQKRAQQIEVRVPGCQVALLEAFGCQRGGIDAEGVMAVGSRQENLVVAAGYLAQRRYSWLEALALADDAFQAAEAEMGWKARLTPPYPGTAAMLARLARRTRLGVLSSDAPGHVNDFVAFHNLQPHLAYWRGTAASDPAKPAPTLLLEVCRQLQAVPGRTVVVGDSHVDLRLARQAGAQAFISVSVAWGSQPVGGADGVMESWNDLAIDDSLEGA